MKASVPYEPLRVYTGSASDVVTAGVCGVGKESVWRWRTNGTVPASSADRVACHIGVHVLNIWPDFHEKFSR